MGKVRPVRKIRMWLGKKLTILVNPVKRLWDLKKEKGEGYMVAGLEKVDHMIGKLEGMIVMVMVVVVGGWEGWVASTGGDGGMGGRW